MMPDKQQPQKPSNGTVNAIDEVSHRKSDLNGSSSMSSFDDKLANSLEVSNNTKTRLLRNHPPDSPTLQIIRETFRRYPPAELFVSFNGGKDCTVLLHLVDTVFAELHPATSAATDAAPHILCLYLQSAEPFDEIEQFVDECTQRYPSIRLERSAGGRQTKQQALFDLCAEHPRMRACLMGCRRSDPWCERLATFEETTSGWPPLMRVNPLLEWTCADVWDYVDRFAVPYCRLYDEG